MAKHYDKQFKRDAVQYYHDHRELGLQGCASNLGISQQTLSRWQKELRETGDIESRGSGNYASDEAKEKLFVLWEESRKYKNAGNGRAARNVFEKTIEVQSNRIIENNITDINLVTTIEAVDIPLPEDVFY